MFTFSGLGVPDGETAVEDERSRRVHCRTYRVNNLRGNETNYFLTNFTPHQALVDMPPGGERVSTSFMSMTTRNILRANGKSPEVYAVSAN